MRLNCQGSKVKFLAEACPIDIPWDKSHNGTCIIGMEKPFETMAQYYLVGGDKFNDPGFDLDTLRKTCVAIGGTWGRESGKSWVFVGEFKASPDSKPKR